MKHKKMKLVSIGLLGLVLVGCAANKLEVQPLAATSTESVQRDILFQIQSDYIYANDPQELKNLVLDPYTTIIQITALSSTADTSGVFVKDLQTLGSNKPVTPVSIKIDSVLYGQPIDQNLSTVYLDGGIVSIDDLYHNLPAGDVQKMNLGDLNENERKTKFAAYSSESDVTLEKGKQYILVVYKQTDAVYTVAGNAYGTFAKAETPTTANAKSVSSFINPLSNRDFDTELTALKAANQ